MSHRMEHRSGFPHRVNPAEYLRYKLKGSGSDSKAMMRREFDLRSSEGMDLTNPFSGKLTSMNEKELLRGLNDRFAGFIEKVRYLEHQNNLLESEIEEIRARAQSPSSLEQEYGTELGELRKLVHDITHQKHQIEIEHQNLEDELLNLRKKHDREARNRSEVESNIMVLKKDINDAYQAKLQLDKKAQSLVDEIHFLKKNHEAEVSEMIAQIQEAHVTVEAHDFGKPDLTAALRDIRAQLEGHAVSDLQQAGESFRSQFAKLTEAAETKREALKATQQEIHEYRRRLQAKGIELDCAKGTREALERQLHEVEDRHNDEIIHYQGTIKELENELINAKFDMSGHLREYQDLLNVKMALDVEILSYRKLLEGEESRLSSISDTQISMPYIYRQSPVYTLPCLSRQGGPTRRAEPQYKFVEEIITETTREIEMSEFEETGFEERVGGEGEEGGVKAERGSSEREADSGNKDSPEGEGDQVSDSQQDQVEAVETTEHGGPGKEEEDGQKDNEVREGSEESETVKNKEDTDTDKTSQSEVPSVEATGEGENEKCDSGAEKIKGETEDAGGIIAVQRDATSKPEESKPEVPVEGETPEELKKAESEDERKEGALKESKGPNLKDRIATAQENKPEGGTPAQESKDLGKPQEPSSAVKVQDEALSLPSETVMKTVDLTAEPMSSVPKEIVAPVKPLENLVQETPSKAPKSEEKEENPTAPKAVSKADTAKATTEDKVPKSSEKDTHDESKEKDKGSESSLKSDLKVVEDEKSSNGDKTQTVESRVPEKKIAAESKDLQQGVPDSGKTQEQSDMSKKPEKIKDPNDKTEKVEDVKGKDSGEATDCQSEGKPQQGEVAKSATSPQKEQDASNLSLKEKTVNGQISQGEEVKIENGLSNGAEINEDEKTKPVKVVAQTEPVKEEKAEPKTSV